MRWTIKPEPDIQKVQALKESLGVDSALARLLLQRGVETYEQARLFFNPSLENLHDPFLMKEMDKAVLRIADAIVKKQSILVYGDYDVDGTTSVALMGSFLKRFYKEEKIDLYIPDRYKEGYGISFQGIDYAVKKKHSLIIALDCGIKAVDQVNYAKKKGIDFIICDHHQPSDCVPQAISILNPKQKGCNYPYKELSGCGVGFKLIQALTEKDGGSIQSIVSYLDLVALSIASDLVPITGENRILCFFGLKVINDNPRVGINVITQDLKNRDLNVEDLVFKIAPKINASGRIKHGLYSVELLMEQDVSKANELIKKIEEFNSIRIELEQSIKQEAVEQIIDSQEHNAATTVVYKENWHKGIIGIVASKLIETFYRPTLVFTKSDKVLVASARSIKDFNIYNAIEACKEHIIQFGGHKYAAGLTISPKKYADFKKDFDEYVKDNLPNYLKTPEIQIDSEVNIDNIDSKFYRILKRLAPFRPENGESEPLFIASELKDIGYCRKVGKSSSHIKLDIAKGIAPTKCFDAIGFGLGKKWDEIENFKTFDSVFSLGESNWKSKCYIQFKLKDIKKRN